MPFPPDLPPHDQLADEDDELGWDREKHGKMIDAATEDNTVATVEYDPMADPFLTGRFA